MYEKTCDKKIRKVIEMDLKSAKEFLKWYMRLYDICDICELFDKEQLINNICKFYWDWAVIDEMEQGKVSKEQAESFLRTSIAKAIATGTIEEGQKFGYISTFEFKLSENLETHIFENADVDWLHCIAAHRKKKMFIEVEREMAKYDIIAGKIADDATNATLTAYLAGAFGTAGDKVADDFCIRQLLPNKLKDQYCFKTEAAIECLKFVKGEKIWLK